LLTGVHRAGRWRAEDTAHAIAETQHCGFDLPPGTNGFEFSRR
jgi:hypothetical protein